MHGCVTSPCAGATRRRRCRRMALREPTTRHALPRARFVVRASVECEKWNAEPSRVVTGAGGNRAYQAALTLFNGNGAPHLRMLSCFACVTRRLRSDIERPIDASTSRGQAPACPRTASRAAGARRVRVARPRACPSGDACRARRAALGAGTASGVGARSQRDCQQAPLGRGEVGFGGAIAMANLRSAYELFLRPTLG